MTECHASNVKGYRELEKLKRSIEGVFIYSMLSDPKVWLQLLYLVPCCCGSVLITATVKGDLSRIFSFTDTSSKSLLAALEEKKQ